MLVEVRCYHSEMNKWLTVERLPLATAMKRLAMHRKIGSRAKIEIEGHSKFNQPSGACANE